MCLKQDISQLQQEIESSLGSTEFQTGIGLSRKLDARDAGREVAKTAIKNLKHKPSFLLLFSTIHYKKNQFKEFLNGVWDVLPEGTPLVGGSIAGFITNNGCFTRGATALAVYYPHIKVGIGIGNNTKRSPNTAAKQATSMLKKQFKDTTEYPNKFILDIISGTKIMEIPFVGQKNVIQSKTLAKFLRFGLKMSTNILQKGPGREEEILKKITQELPEFSLTHISTIDDMSLLESYQFVGKKVLDNSLVLLGIETDIDFTMDFSNGATVVEKIEITKSSLDKRLIDHIDNKPACNSITQKTGLPKQFFFNDKDWQKRFPYFPLAYKKNGRFLPRAVVMVLNNALFTKTRIENKNAYILQMSGQNMFSSLDNMLKQNKFQKMDTHLIFGVSCAIRLTALGDKIYKTFDLLKKQFQETPFLIVYSAGEGMYTPKEKLFVLEESININCFGKTR